MVFGFFRRKPSFNLKKLSLDQDIELEYTNQDGDTVLLYGVLIKISKKNNLYVRFAKEMPTDLEVNQEVKLSVIVDNIIYTFNSILKHSEEDVFIFSPPGKDIQQKEIDVPDNELTLAVKIPIEYRATYSVHEQKGFIRYITQNSFIILTNVMIPKGTALTFKISLPHRPEISFTGAVTDSVKIPDDKTKHETTVEYTEIDEESRNLIFNYSKFFFRHPYEE